MSQPAKRPVSMIGNQESTLGELISNINSISSLPLIYNRLNDAINHPRTSVKDIAQIISEDPGLTARILKLANSTMYGFSGVDSISRAVTLIGTRELRDLALATSVLNNFPSIPDDLLNMEKYRQHSLACGAYARNIAVYLREPSIEKFFVAGILHDIGHLVMCAIVPDSVRLICDRSEDNAVCRVENDVLGFDHAAVGGELLTSWKIPRNISELVSFHHSPADCVQYPTGATIVHLAELTCLALGYCPDMEINIPPLDEIAYEKLKFPNGAIETIVQQTEGQLAEVFTILLES